MSDKTLYVLEKGLWDASHVIGVFGSLKSAVDRIEKLVGKTEVNETRQRPGEASDPETLVFTCREDAPKWFADWFRVTAVEPSWE